MQIIDLLKIQKSHVENQQWKYKQNYVFESKTFESVDSKKTLAILFEGLTNGIYR